MPDSHEDRVLRLFAALLVDWEPVPRDTAPERLRALHCRAREAAEVHAKWIDDGAASMFYKGPSTAVRVADPLSRAALCSECGVAPRHEYPNGYVAVLCLRCINVEANARALRLEALARDKAARDAEATQEDKLGRKGGGDV